MLLILDTHPVQYRVPVYQELARLRPDAFRVLYATDCSVGGYHDPGFGTTVKWKLPLLDGYACEVLNAGRNGAVNGFRSLAGGSVARRINQLRPSAVLFTGFEYEYFARAYATCLARRVPIWIRQETQDEAFPRGPLKGIVRHVTYRALYGPIAHAFYIGELNRRHYRRHGLGEGRLSRSPYCVRNPLVGLGSMEKAEARVRLRRELGLEAGTTVVGFAGKFIPKKDPGLLIDAAARLTGAAVKDLALLFIGSGELESELRQRAAAANVRAIFTGFLNQDRLPFFYLAADVFVLPSRRMGETWGLVINEALQAGCAVVVSEAAGCSEEFGQWERCRVIPVGDAAACARAIEEFNRMPRSFEWARQRLEDYSVEAAARAIAGRLP